MDGAVAARQKRRDRPSRGALPNFTVTDNVLVTRVMRPCLHHELVSTWRDPWRAVNNDMDDLYIIDTILAGKTRGVHVVRMCFLSDEQLLVTSRLQDIFST